jgi:hypothetical protein
MQPVTRRSFIATGTAGALGVAGAAAIGSPFVSAAAAETSDVLTAADAAAVSGPTLVKIVDAARGKIEILTPHRTIKVTDPTLVHRIARASR